MCGICGVVQISDGPLGEVIAPETIEAMTDAMIHRGPNDRGVRTGPGFALGARRLSIVDIDGGHQPISNEDGGVWAAQNGELYNHEEIRAELSAAGHRFTSRCDTEVIPHLYEECGAAFPERLRGKFAIAVWDESRRRAVVARDRLGVKPLYYAQRDDRLVFASELKSLLASGLIDGELDYEAIHAYLTLGYVPAPRTPLAGVFKLQPGHRIVIEDGAMRVERYWSYPEPATEPADAGPEELAAGLIEQLDRAVRLRLMSDVPLGVMLSGGLDSSLIVALMARAQPEPVRTFSIGFAEDGPLNELGDARRVAKLFGTDHHELELSLSEREVDLDELIWSLEEPIAELSALGFAALSELAARHVTVAMSGQGADELLGGYRKHRAAALTDSWLRVPRTVRRVAESVASRGRLGASRAVRTLTAADPVERHLAMSGLVEADSLACLLDGPLAEVSGAPARDAISTLAGEVDGGALPAALHLDAQLALVDNMLHYFDRTSMSHSLEVRVPFLDHHVVEYCARLPNDLKVRRLRSKHILKEGTRGLLPDDIINKRKVGFFRGSTGGWLGAQLDTAVSTYLLREDASLAELLDRSAVADLIEARRQGRGNPQLLLAILMLELWLTSFLPRALRKTPGSTSAATTQASAPVGGDSYEPKAHPSADRCSTE